MWGQVSLEKALRAFLSGRTVKAVDLPGEVIRDLSEVMEALSDGVVFFAETVATENIEFKEAVEDMMTKNAVTEPEVEEDDYDRRDPTASAAVLGLGDGMSRLKGTEPEAPAPKKRGRKITNGKSVGRNKPVSQVEAEWAARKVNDIPKLKALRTAGWTVKALADEFHCTETTVTETMEKEGIA